MELPNYFLADLPPEAELSGGMIIEACAALKRNRERYLAGRPTSALIKTLADVAAEYFQPDNEIWNHVREEGPARTGFSRTTLVQGLDRFFAEITRENLQKLLLQDLGHLNRLDEMCANDVEQRSSNGSMARSPELLVHISGGMLPNPIFTSMLLGALARSAQFIKCASGSAFLPRMFAHAIYKVDPKLGATIEVAEWKGGREELETPLFAEAECITATGSDAALKAVRNRLPDGVRLLGYGSRVSFAFVTHEMLGKMNAPRIVSRAAQDVSAWNQLGCLSPHLIYVEVGGEMTPQLFAEQLGRELEKIEGSNPRGEISLEEAADISARRSFFEVRAAFSGDTKVYASPDSTAWTVIYDADPLFQLSCLNRFIYVKPVASLDQLLENADKHRRQVSTVGLAAPEHRAQKIATELARWGVSRICPLGKMQEPPLTWRHDGRPALGDLITWADWEL
ncbi:MAG: acyl-CoA reductase [Verrucomicrobiota bacterium]|nr:acyl-CoA reductase [Verrucomicrobiota bacterium]